MVKHTKKMAALALFATSLLALASCGNAAGSTHLTEERRDYYIDYFKDKEIAFDKEMPVIIEDNEQVAEPAPVEHEGPILVIEREPYFKDSDLTPLDAAHNTIESEAYIYGAFGGEQVHSVWTIEYWNEGPASREGYKTLEFRAVCDFPRYDYTGSRVELDVYDYYLGVRFPNDDSMGDVHDNYTTMMLDNYSEYTDSSVENDEIVECDIRYSIDVKWNSNLSDDNRDLTLTYQFEMPDYYDGIVFATTPAYDTNKSYDNNGMGVRAFDDDEYRPGTKYVRIGVGEPW